VRARISVLSEIPERWAEYLHDWSRINECYKAKVDGMVVPDRNEEYLFYQTVVGAWPLQESDWSDLILRLQDYFIKASREANVRTRWVTPNQPHESALREFVAHTLDRETNRAFYASVQQLMDSVGLYGMLNGLSQTLLKCTCPGVPDTYQGSEIWDLRLVDPDNRRAIDFNHRISSFAAIQSSPDMQSGGAVEDLLLKWHDGRVKTHVLTRSLSARQKMPEVFGNGSYRVLSALGEHSHRIVGFARELAEEWCVIVFTRCMASVQGPVTCCGCRRKFWQNTDLLVPAGAPKRWVNILSGNVSRPFQVDSEGRLPLSEVFGEFPLALLVPSSSA
jgi:(1->4)-alpha-D-glucan 1-alpha-D-glucosylmutase